MILIFCLYGVSPLRSQQFDAGLYVDLLCVQPLPSTVIHSAKGTSSSHACTAVDNNWRAVWREVTNAGRIFCQQSRLAVLHCFNQQQYVHARTWHAIIWPGCKLKVINGVLPSFIILISENIYLIHHHKVLISSIENIQIILSHI